MPDSSTSFADYLVALVVDAARSGKAARPAWSTARRRIGLVATLSSSGGPTATAQRIAFEIVREAERCDELLLAFAMRKGALSAQRFACDRMLLAS